MPRQRLPLRSRLLRSRPQGPSGLVCRPISRNCWSAARTTGKRYRLGARKLSFVGASAGCRCRRKNVRTPSSVSIDGAICRLEDRKQLRDRWNKFQSLPPEQRDEVRDNFRRFGTCLRSVASACAIAGRRLHRRSVSACSTARVSVANFVSNARGSSHDKSSNSAVPANASPVCVQRSARCRSLQLPPDI